MKNRIYNKCAYGGWALLALLVLLCTPNNVEAAADAHSSFVFPLWSVVPFVGMLLSIAVCPLINAHWWEENMGKISLFWAALFTIPSGILWGFSQASYEFIHIMLVDYVPFLTLVVGLFVVAGGINVSGRLPNTPLSNTLILLIGTCLASIVGTTGATMLVIRPLINANSDRRMKMHTIIFLIFLVSNIGGSLTPVGDPPLFLGFLHGVPFFWTLKLIVPWLTNVVLLLAVYFALDAFFYTRHKLHISEERIAGKVQGAARWNEITAKEQVSEIFSVHVHNDEMHGEKTRPKIQITGLHNLIFLAGILAAVILSGTLVNCSLFYDHINSCLRGVVLMNHEGHDFKIAYINIARDAFILLMALCSLKFTSKEIRKNNKFTWTPVEEVGLLFAGIFATIVPALQILQVRGSELGVNTPVEFFWATGILSSFLDNAPTYLVFTSMAGQMGATVGVATDLGILNEQVLMAISCGAVFMGANTYIGNAPNFMTKSIAEENGIRMPSFFGYMLWSGAILIPLFLLNTVLFFR